MNHIFIALKHEALVQSFLSFKAAQMVPELLRDGKKLVGWHPAPWLGLAGVRVLECLRGAEPALRQDG